MTPHGRSARLATRMRTAPCARLKRRLMHCACPTRGARPTARQCARRWPTCAPSSPARAYVIRRLGYGLDQRAVEAALQYRFEAATQNGLPQSTWVDVEVKF